MRNQTLLVVLFWVFILYSIIATIMLYYALNLADIAITRWEECSNGVDQIINKVDSLIINSYNH